MPILKVPSLQQTFFKVRPEFNYHLYGYNDVAGKRLWFQTLTTMLRLVVERFVLDVATVILDHTKLDQVIILTSESLCDEDILDIYADYDIKNATKWVVNYQTTPHNLLSFYERIVRRTGKVRSFVVNNKFSEWYQGAMYMKNQRDISGWTTKYQPSLKTLFSHLT